MRDYGNNGRMADAGENRFASCLSRVFRLTSEMEDEARYFHSVVLLLPYRKLRVA